MSDEPSDSDVTASNGPPRTIEERLKANLASSGLEEIPLEALAANRANVSAYVRIDSEAQGRLTYYEDVTTAEQLGPRECEPHHLLDIGGLGTTDGSGSRQFFVTNYLCEGFKIRSIGKPIIITAIPLTQSPVWLTAQTAVVGLPGGVLDVSARVFAWRPGGNPSPNTTFSWRMLIPGFVPFGPAFP